MIGQLIDRPNVAVRTEGSTIVTVGFLSVSATESPLVIPCSDSVAVSVVKGTFFHTSCRRDSLVWIAAAMVRLKSDKIVVGAMCKVRRLPCAACSEGSEPRSTNTVKDGTCSISGRCRSSEEPRSWTP